jgi:hypothetical protein
MKERSSTTPWTEMGQTDEGKNLDRKWDVNYGETIKFKKSNRRFQETLETFYALHTSSP